ncbi:Membrane-bound lytic murein transglycosylase D precursor [Lunatimonas lonarensis]|uniref:Membrane-bound lytic murein transglycosylase D n=1 Tax=Lunatimonas lonarensis TaxID=1232681 RepID=R7ZX90_9BACT|nr:lytic transglycosylase domain-containing protein [Lunatimonas lonarensis]EON78589.1 Membrane-bound lytic murein transglycosylase D precursor [Lunatimonas lonarensis]
MDTKAMFSLFLLCLLLIHQTVNELYAQQSISPSGNGLSSMATVEPQYHFDYIPDYTYADVEKRVEAMKTDMPFQLNETIFSFINYFTVRNRAYTRMVLERKHHYFPLFEEVLRENDMPEDVKFLAVIESGLNPKARSRVGAMGLWQFMPGTGREYQLYANQYIDDRLDPEKSTEAAIRFLKSLHKRYGDWELAMAAYNCGPGNVNKAIKRSGGKRKFWEIYNYLPRETRSYIPQFQAIMYVMRHAELHNLFLEDPVFPVDYQLISWEGHLDLMELSKHSDICMEDLEFLNPALVSTRIPKMNRELSIKVPSTKAAFLAENQRWIQDSLAIQADRFVAEMPKPTPFISSSGHTVTYRVQSGDVLGGIAQRYNVSVANLKAWNGINGNLIRVGQVLHIHQPTSTLDKPTLASNSSPLQVNNENGSKVYTVQPGDSLWLISSRLEGVTIEQLKKLNNLNTNQIKPGQKLIIG